MFPAFQRETLKSREGLGTRLDKTLCIENFQLEAGFTSECG